MRRTRQHTSLAAGRTRVFYACGTATLQARCARRVLLLESDTRLRLYRCSTFSRLAGAVPVAFVAASWALALVSSSTRDEHAFRTATNAGNTTRRGARRCGICAHAAKHSGVRCNVCTVPALCNWIVRALPCCSCLPTRYY